MKKLYDFIDDDGNILLWRLGSSRGSPGDPRYLPPDLVEALFRMKIARMKQETLKNVALLEEAAARKAAQSPTEDEEGAVS